MKPNEPAPVGEYQFVITSTVGAAATPVGVHEICSLAIRLCAKACGREFAQAKPRHNSAEMAAVFVTGGVPHSSKSRS